MPSSSSSDTDKEGVLSTTFSRAPAPVHAHRPRGHEIQIQYRTLSLHVDSYVDGKQKPVEAKTADPATALRQIDVHGLSVDEVYTRFSTSPSLGLEKDAIERRSKAGKNVISSPPTQYWKKGLNYVFGGFNFLMWIAFIVTVLSYEPLGGSDPAVFNLGVAVLLLLVIIISSTFYALVDWHASRIMNSIKTLIAEDASVIRNGEHQTIPARDLVVGDVVTLAMGDRVPADLRLVQISNDVRFDRSLLTGESDMIAGTLDMTSNNALETRNLALTSTFVVQGSCTGVVFAVGDKTVMGRIVAMSGKTKMELTTVQREIWYFTKIISTLALGLFCVALIVWAAWLRKSFPGFETASQAIVNSIGCLTAFVPQGLPVCVALSLTIVAKRMAKRNVLVKNLATIETLGCMSVLCSDKTGTLTMGKMSVQNVAFVDAELGVQGIKERLSVEGTPSSAPKAILMVARLCNGAKFDSATAHLPIEERQVKGDATDTAVLRFAETLSATSEPALPDNYVKFFEIPFNSKNKWMLTAIRPRPTPDTKADHSTWMLVKGAPDVLSRKCTEVMQADGTVVPLTQALRTEIFGIQERWSSEGQRVLALCRRSLDALAIEPGMSANDLEELMNTQMRGLTLVGLVGIRDPPRPDVPGAVATIRRAGVRVFMVTGDFKLTAVAIARQVGIITQEKVDTLQDLRASASTKRFQTLKASEMKPLEEEGERALVLTGDDIESLQDADWNSVVGSYTEIVFARTTPEQKLRIVENTKARGDNTVAVTGDGVNDAPALKAADIGVAMGAGSDVAKEAASMILLNNDFTSIVVAIEMGRLVFDNLKKVITYLMPAGSYTEFVAVFCNTFLGMQLALSSYLQVCFCITNDVVMSISLMYEKPEADLMLRKPRNARTDRLTDWRFFVQVYLFIGLMMWPCAMGMWFLYMKEQGLGFYDVILVYNKWTEGFHGYTLDQLTDFVSVGQCIYYVTLVFMQYGGLLAVRNRRVSILQSNPLWGPRRNLVVPVGMVATAIIAVINIYGPGLQRVFDTTPVPGMFWGIPFAFAVGILAMDEGRKLLVRTYPNSLVAKAAW
ncbi:calcium ATPase transmembrane domain M-containing protein [Trametes versicolor FP-101664 SS1]|uniref:calcium ATPase transmembrane domain M-containing protein n=1 Tax=Trametes versicolor (strain FP-101664) TaxID=717944 RepID=UPI0004622716|nr:calcium ATPase transmembrane domain M-containing protein [Trametes versicolor FP-101664 SS1]EIW55428.1 calcium ATPase transmembrane domain M-containing protein [Trametes versicolor FP-101664 SS1]